VRLVVLFVGPGTGEVNGRDLRPAVTHQLMVDELAAVACLSADRSLSSPRSGRGSRARGSSKCPQTLASLRLGRPRKALQVVWTCLPAGRCPPHRASSRGGHPSRRRTAPRCPVPGSRGSLQAIRCATVGRAGWWPGGGARYGPGAAADPAWRDWPRAGPGARRHPAGDGRPRSRPTTRAGRPSGARRRAGAPPAR
jgi:hypothetical protein